MTNSQCLSALLYRGWNAMQDGCVRSPGFVFSITFSEYSQSAVLWLGAQCIAEGDTIAELLGKTMPDSAAVTVATYFGLRSPGGV